MLDASWLKAQGSWLMTHGRGGSARLRGPRVVICFDTKAQGRWNGFRLISEYRYKISTFESMSVIESTKTLYNMTLSK